MLLPSLSQTLSPTTARSAAWSPDFGVISLGPALLQVGGMVLAEGQVAEMATGEGKTLVATLAGEDPDPTK